jgi:hypothetical protein
VSESYAQLPEQLCFDHREAGELLNLLHWFKEMLVAESDDPEEGYPDDRDD